MTDLYHSSRPDRRPLRVWKSGKLKSKTMFGRKRKNLQPWLDYFEMLQTYESKGFLEVKPAEHEAYVTQPGLHAMSEGDDPRQQIYSAIPKTVRRLRAYAGWRSQEGKSYMKQPFAVHVVKDMEPYDPLYSMVIETRRHWWRLWIPSDYIDVIDYKTPEP